MEELWRRDLEPEARESARVTAEGVDGCPACGGVLSEDATRCTQCGLRFG
jgi:hypothetical protein